MHTVPCRQSGTWRPKRSPELGLALDVDDLAAAGAHAARDPHRAAERVAAQVDDRQAIHLADDAAVGEDADPALGDVLAHAQLDEALAVGAGLQRLPDVRRRDLGRALLLGEERRLAHQIGDLAEASRQLVLVVAHPGRVLEHPTRPLDRQRQQALLVRQPGKEPHVVQQPVLRPRHLDLEVDLDLEELGEVEIGARKCVVDLGDSDQADLDAQLDRLGPQRRHRHHAARLAGVVQLDLPVLERALQALPRRRVAQQVGRVQQQIAAVGAIQRTGFDAR